MDVLWTSSFDNRWLNATILQAMERKKGATDDIVHLFIDANA
jgi:hypothetical protein